LLFKSKPRLPFDSKCFVHGHELQITTVDEGAVTEFEANQGWTKQRPDWQRLFSRTGVLVRERVGARLTDISGRGEAG
jgi:hypothetical protein